jgi:Zn-finger nucleic acid-binding protein
MMMEKATINSRAGQLTLDHCLRCGGVWFERGEVQQLAVSSPRDLWSKIAPRTDVPKPPCPGRGCGAPLDRDAEHCGACGRKNVINCPLCDDPMERRTTNGLTLDLCRRCQGVWFDNKELSAIWTLNVAAASRRQSGGAAQAAAIGGDILLDTMFWNPWLAGEAIAGVANVGGAALEVAGSAAESIFDVIVSIISSIFDGS